VVFRFRELDINFSYNEVMRRWLCIAASYLVLLTLPVWAQRHGGGGHFSAGQMNSGGGLAGHFTGSMLSGSTGRNFTALGHNFSITHSFGNPETGNREIGNRATRNPGFRSGDFENRSGMHGRSERSESDHRDSHRHRHFYPYGYPYYSWYADPFYLGGDYQNSDYSGGYSDQDSSAVTDPNRYDQAPSPEDNGLQRDVQALSGKIDRLQADVEARNQPKSDPEPLTALVFRDQHVLEVRNYAISGGTLWVMGEQGAKKIPLSQLDLDATAKMNDDRGVDFQIPK
jgi:hypothetical protein